MKIKLKHGIYTSKSPAEVFAVLCNPEMMLLWQSSMFEITGKVNATQDGALQLGTKVSDRRNVLGKELRGEWEVIGFEQEKRLVLRVSTGSAPWETTYTLEALEGGTFLGADGAGDVGDVPMSPLSANKSCARLFTADLASLADLLES